MIRKSPLLEKIIAIATSNNQEVLTIEGFMETVLAVLKNKSSILGDNSEESSTMRDEYMSIKNLFTDKHISIDSSLVSVRRLRKYLGDKTDISARLIDTLFDVLNSDSGVTALAVCEFILTNDSFATFRKTGLVSLSFLDNSKIGQTQASKLFSSAEPAFSGESGDIAKMIADFCNGKDDDCEINIKASQVQSENRDEEKDDALDPKKQQGALKAITERVEKVKKYLTDSVFGQSKAISSFISGYFQGEISAITQTKRNKPRATFLFAGPPGVGKTFLAEQAAAAMGIPYMRFDMSEYSDKEANLAFCGAEAFYKNAKSGNVTQFVHDHPRSLLLFDEVEKAHLNVIYLFLQILDGGRLRDNCMEKEISFTDTIIIFTTNAGKNLYEDEAVNLNTVSGKTILKSLATDTHPVTGGQMFPSAICSRFATGNVIMFNRIGVDHLLKVSSAEISKQVANIKNRLGVTMTFDSRLPYALLYAEGANVDARTIKFKSGNFVYQELYELSRLINGKKDAIDLDRLSSVSLEVKIPQDKEIRKFFEQDEKASVLVFASQEVCARCKEILYDTVEVLSTGDINEAKTILLGGEVACVLADITYGKKTEGEVMNIDDFDSLGRDFIHYTVEYARIPVYVMRGDGLAITEDEQFSLVQSGIKDVVCMKEDTDYSLKNVISEAGMTAYLNKRLLELAVANKIISHKTLQAISDDGQTATIALFDFHKSTAVAAGDYDGMVDAMSRPGVRFADVIGAKDAKEELQYFIRYLKSPGEFKKRGIKAPKGVLLYGPPGTGKTLLAKAMAGESDITFIQAQGNQFLSKWVGEGAKAIHDIFRTARKYAPSILFIDEIDSISKNRGSEGGAENANTLTALLSEMDGFKEDAVRPVFVLAATNYTPKQGNVRSLDPAMVRRFDRRILIDLPNRDERLQFIKQKIGKIANHSLTDEQIENLAMRSVDASLAELDSIIELAMRNLIKSQNYILTDAILEEAYESFNNGAVKKWSDSDLLNTARHEAGHALISYAIGRPPAYVTIISRGNYGGYMQSEADEEKMGYTKEEMLGIIRRALGGRAAEIVYYGAQNGSSTGASGDLHQATQVAFDMLCRYGMMDDFGLASLSKEEMIGTELYAKTINAINGILAYELESAIAILNKNKPILDKLVNELLNKNSLKSNEIITILKDISK